MNPQIKIEKDIPIPPPKTVSGGIEATLKIMDIGDSIIIPIRSRGFIYTSAKRAGVKVTCRQIEGTMDTLRLWKTA